MCPEYSPFIFKHTHTSKARANHSLFERWIRFNIAQSNYLSNHRLCKINNKQITGGVCVWLHSYTPPSIGKRYFESCIEIKSIMNLIWCRMGMGLWLVERWKLVGFCGRGGVNAYRRSGLSLACFLIRNNMVVYHWSSREMLSYSLTASVKPSMFCSSKCSHSVCNTENYVFVINILIIEDEEHFRF